MAVRLQCVTMRQVAWSSGAVMRPRLLCQNRPTLTARGQNCCERMDWSKDHAIERQFGIITAACRGHVVAILRPAFTCVYSVGARDYILLPLMTRQMGIDTLDDLSARARTTKKRTNKDLLATIQAISLMVYHI